MVVLVFVSALRWYVALCSGVRRNLWLKPHIANVVGPYGIARRCHSQWLVFALIPLEAQALTQAYREGFIETSSGRLGQGVNP